MEGLHGNVARTTPDADAMDLLNNFAKSMGGSLHRLPREALDTLLSTGLATDKAANEARAERMGTEEKAKGCCCFR